MQGHTEILLKQLGEIIGRDACGVADHGVFKVFAVVQIDILQRVFHDPPGFCLLLGGNAGALGLVRQIAQEHDGHLHGLPLEHQLIAFAFLGKLAVHVEKQPLERIALLPGDGGGEDLAVQERFLFRQDGLLLKAEGALVGQELSFGILEEIDVQHVLHKLFVADLDGQMRQIRGNEQTGALRQMPALAADDPVGVALGVVDEDVVEILPRAFQPDGALDLDHADKGLQVCKVLNAHSDPPSL